MKISFNKNKTVAIVAAIFGLLVTLLIFSYVLKNQEKEPIKIGLVSTLTGPASTAGISARDGAVLAIDQVNKKGGVNGRFVQAVVRDDKADFNEALRVDKELIDAGVAAFLGHYLSSVSVKVVPLMNERNVLMLSLGAATGDLYGLDDSFVRITLPNNIRTPLAARETFKRAGIRRVAIVCDLYNAAYTQSVLDIYSKEFKRIGGQIVKTITFNSKESFNAPEIAEQLVGSGADGLFIITDAIHGAVICQHVRQRNSSIPIVACAWAACVPEFIANGGLAVEGVITVVERDDDSTNPIYLAFQKAYRDRFGQPPSLHAQDAYEITNMLLKTLEKTTVPEELKEEFIKQGLMKGIHGDIGVDRNGEPIRPVYAMQIQDGKRKVIDILEPNILVP